MAASDYARANRTYHSGNSRCVANKRERGSAACIGICQRQRRLLAAGSGSAAILYCIERQRRCKRERQRRFSSIDDDDRGCGGGIRRQLDHGIDDSDGDDDDDDCDGDGIVLPIYAQVVLQFSFFHRTLVTSQSPAMSRRYNVVRLMRLLDLKALISKNVSMHIQMIRDEMEHLDYLDCEIADMRCSMATVMAFKQHKHLKQKKYYKNRKDVRKMQPPSNTPLIAEYWSPNDQRRIGGILVAQRPSAPRSSLLHGPR